MPIRINQDSVFAVGQIPFNQFPNLVTAHLRQVPNTRELEGQGCLLRETNFQDEQLESFIRSVCHWGGYSGIAGRILNRNSLAHIREQFINATKHLSEAEPDVIKGLEAINKITGLGQPSFASKHLRFLCPEVCPVLDSLISAHLTYQLNCEGYKEYWHDATTVANRLSELNIPNPMQRDRNDWFVGDIDMALFAHIRKWGE